MSKYNWSEVPNWVQWIATDADGRPWGYEKHPLPPDNYLFGCWYFDSVVLLSENVIVEQIDDFRESLEERPECQ